MQYQATRSPRDLCHHCWQLWPEPVELELPFRPFHSPQAAATPGGLDDGRRPTLLSRLTNRLLGSTGTKPPEDHGREAEFDEPEPAPWYGHEETSQLVVAVPPDLDVPREAAEQFLLVIPLATGPIAIELFGSATSVRLLISCASADEPSISQCLKVYFPEVLVARGSDVVAPAWDALTGDEVVVDFGLAHEFMVPLRLLKRFDIDPLAGIVAGLSDLGEGEAGLFQVLLRRAQPKTGRPSRCL